MLLIFKIIISFFGHTYFKICSRYKGCLSKINHVELALQFSISCIVNHLVCAICKPY